MVHSAFPPPGRVMPTQAGIQ